VRTVSTLNCYISDSLIVKSYSSHVETWNEGIRPTIRVVRLKDMDVNEWQTLLVSRLFTSTLFKFPRTNRINSILHILIVPLTRKKFSVTTAVFMFKAKGQAVQLTTHSMRFRSLPPQKCLLSQWVEDSSRAKEGLRHWNSGL
jgi:hypothetical protein